MQDVQWVTSFPKSLCASSKVCGMDKGDDNVTAHSVGKSAAKDESV